MEENKAHLPFLPSPHVTKVVHNFEVSQFCQGSGGNLGGRHSVKEVHAPQLDEEHAEDVLVEDDQVAHDPLRHRVVLAGYLAAAPKPAKAGLGLRVGNFREPRMAVYRELKRLHRCRGVESRLGSELGITSLKYIFQACLEMESNDVRLSRRLSFRGCRLTCSSNCMNKLSLDKSPTKVCFPTGTFGSPVTFVPEKKTVPDSSWYLRWISSVPWGP